MINYNSRPNLIYNLTNWWYTYSVCKNWIFNSTLYSATMITFCRGVIRISKPWVPVSYFAPKSRPQIAFLLWFQAFFLKSTGAKKNVLEIDGCLTPAAPVLTAPLFLVLLYCQFHFYWKRNRFFLHLYVQKRIYFTMKDHFCNGTKCVPKSIVFKIGKVWARKNRTYSKIGH